MNTEMINALEDKNMERQIIKASLSLVTDLLELFISALCWIPENKRQEWIFYPLLHNFSKEG